MSAGPLVPRVGASGRPPQVCYRGARKVNRARLDREEARRDRARRKAELPDFPATSDVELVGAAKGAAGPAEPAPDRTSQTSEDPLDAPNPDDPNAAWWSSV